MTVGEFVALLRGLPFADDEDVIIFESAEFDWRVQQVARQHHVVYVTLVPIDGSRYDRRDHHALASEVARDRD